MSRSILFQASRRAVWKSYLIGIGVALIGFIAAATTAYPCKLAWQASPDDRVTGYAVYYGVVGSLATNRLDVGLAETATIYDLTASSNYFVYVVSYIPGGIESEPSNIIYPCPQALSALRIRQLPPSNKLCLEAWAATNASCWVESSPSLSAPQWKVLQTVTADSNGKVMIIDSTRADARFYRIGRAP